MTDKPEVTRSGTFDMLVLLRQYREFLLSGQPESEAIDHGRKFEHAITESLMCLVYGSDIFHDIETHKENMNQGTW